MANPKRLSEGYPDGTVLGNSVTDKIGFFNKTCVTCRSAPASIGATATSAVLKAAINKINTVLKLYGLIV